MKQTGYKESGVRWLGRVPADWGVTKIKRHCLVKRGASPRPIDDQKYFSDTGDYAWVRISDVTASDKYLVTSEQRLSELGASLSVKREPGDIFVSICASVGKPVITRIKCCIHDGFVWFDRLKLEPEYLFYLFVSGEMFKGLGNWGTQLNLNTDIIAEIEIPIPSLAEQRRIAGYLDEATGKVDRLVALRRRQMELLREQRAALIQQAVTRGLNFKAALRGVKLGWVDQIPEHWRTSKLRRVTSGIGDGLHGTPLFAEQSPFYFVNGNNLVDGAVKIFPETRCVSEAEYRRLWLPLGGCTVMLSINGTLGNVALFRGEPVILGKSAAYINCSKEIERTFLMYVFQSGSAAHFLQQEATGTTILNLSLEAIRNFLVVLPPLEEQKAIVQFIETETAKLDGLHRSYEQQLALLTEYRAALIHECVTGQRA